MPLRTGRKTLRTAVAVDDHHHEASVCDARFVFVQHVLLADDAVRIGRRCPLIVQALLSVRSAPRF